MYLIFELYNQKINPKTLDSFQNYNIIIFTNLRQNNLSKLKLTILKRTTPLKWTDVFNFILNNKDINKKGCLVHQHNKPIVDFTPKQGVTVLENGVFIKNLKNRVILNRNLFTHYELLKYKTNNAKKIKVLLDVDPYFNKLVKTKQPDYIDFYQENDSSICFDYKLTLKVNLYPSDNLFFKEIWKSQLHKLIEFDKLKEKILNKENINLSNYKNIDISIPHGWNRI